jgi:hypothetical protein
MVPTFKIAKAVPRTTEMKRDDKTNQFRLPLPKPESRDARKAPEDARKETNDTRKDTNDTRKDTNDTRKAPEDTRKAPETTRKAPEDTRKAPETTRKGGPPPIPPSRNSVMRPPDRTESDGRWTWRLDLPPPRVEDTKRQPPPPPLRAANGNFNSSSHQASTSTSTAMNCRNKLNSFIYLYYNCNNLNSFTIIISSEFLLPSSFTIFSSIHGFV